MYMLQRHARTETSRHAKWAHVRIVGFCQFFYGGDFGRRACDQAKRRKKWRTHGFRTINGEPAVSDKKWRTYGFRTGSGEPTVFGQVSGLRNMKGTSVKTYAL